MSQQENPFKAEPDLLFRDPGFSLTAQPYLRELLEDLTASSEGITFVIGAGTSLDAGLPTWAGLLANMASLVQDPRWRKAALRDTAEPARRAEYLGYLALEDSDSEHYQIVRQALYSRNVRPAPGPLADAVARLIATLGGRARVVTTNFDTLIEAALARYNSTPTVQYTLENRAEWAGLPDIHEGQVPIMHIHGILEPNRALRGPLILTESEFLAYGPDARALIADELRGRVTIFIGVSLTDPNLVGPLFDTRDENIRKCNAYTLSVASGADPEERAYSVKKACILEPVLAVKTIHAKSFTQQTQMLLDMSLAMRRPTEYLGAGDGSGKLHYGSRFVEGLERCYAAIGCQPEDPLPQGEAALTLSKSLRAALSEAQKLIAAKIQDLRHSNDGDLKRHVALLAASLESERFGLFLWLRARAEYGAKRPYAIRLMGSSTYTHHEIWSLDREADIAPESRHTAARALYYGNSLVQNLPRGAEWQLWNGCSAIPFTVTGLHDVELDQFDAAFDTIMPGVVTLNTTKYVSRPKGMEDDEWHMNASAFSVFSAKDIRDINQNVVSSIQELIRG